MPLLPFLFALFFVVPQASQAALPTPERVELCAVAGSGAGFEGKYLEITGLVAGSQPDHLLLTSTACPFAVKLAFTAEVQGHEDVRILYAALKRGGSVVVTVEGRYHYSGEASAVGLQVEGIDHLEFPKH